MPDLEIRLLFDLDFLERTRTELLKDEEIRSMHFT